VLAILDYFLEAWHWSQLIYSSISSYNNPIPQVCFVVKSHCRPTGIFHIITTFDLRLYCYILWTVILMLLEVTRKPLGQYHWLGQHEPTILAQLEQTPKTKINLYFLFSKYHTQKLYIFFIRHIPNYLTYLDI